LSGKVQFLIKAIAVFYPILNSDTPAKEKSSAIRLTPKTLCGISVTAKSPSNKRS
jgi:hypothetical protein